MGKLMTDQDNLRNRIAEIFYQDGNGALALNMSPNERNELAQAIIDELGLTIEQRDTGLQSNPPGRRIYVSRVIGDWED